MIGSVKGKLLVLGVFVLGIGIGGIGTYEYQTRIREPIEVQNNNRGQRERRAQRDVRRFHDYLELTEEQRVQVNALLEENRERFRALQDKTRPEFEALQDETRGRIRALLTLEQQQKYDEYYSTRRRDGRRRD